MKTTQRKILGKIIANEIHRRIIACMTIFSKKTLPLWLLTVNSVVVFAAIGWTLITRNLVSDEIYNVSYYDASMRKLEKVSNPETKEYLRGLLDRDEKVSRALESGAEALYRGARGQAVLASLSWLVIFWMLKSMPAKDEAPRKDA